MVTCGLQRTVLAEAYRLNQVRGVPERPRKQDYELRLRGLEFQLL